MLKPVSPSFWFSLLGTLADMTLRTLCQLLQGAGCCWLFCGSRGLNHWNQTLFIHYDSQLMMEHHTRSRQKWLVRILVIWWKQDYLKTETHWACTHPTKQQIDSSSVTILTTPQISSFLSFVNIRVQACLLLSLRTNRSNLLYLSHTTSYTHRLTVLLLGLVICKTN